MYIYSVLTDLCKKIFVFNYSIIVVSSLIVLGIRTEIINSTSPELEEARNLINNIQSRKIPKNIYEYQYSTGDINLVSPYNKLHFFSHLYFKKKHILSGTLFEPRRTSNNIRLLKHIFPLFLKVFFLETGRYRSYSTSLTAKLQTPGVTTINSVMIYISRSKWDRRNEVIEVNITSNNCGIQITEKYTESEVLLHTILNISSETTTFKKNRS
uniref:Uncharacterized protein n=1 Tax=Heterorhabditis bacteriophora TaxID=37862 RepID=A0A1I7WGW9_HETBA